MFFAEARVRVFIYGQPVDARKSYDGLYALARNEMKQDPLSGHLFCFINRRANQVKVLYWDRSGFCLWSKRLEQGRQYSASCPGHPDRRCPFPEQTRQAHPSR
ncbi:MAG: IS66 family insertion sequence element accessory protein TnpB [Ferrovum myxofaciens]|uniref:IS66 family insertion sequence element accessory protein TnpB n=1 Tax=Ferrovum myxofaciens TaxID=416213 RepID=UPI002357A5A5|nr:IS66 family insertion sequence element accessory protein TnpB [Ferrovum myxofaciens]QKE39930.1 MAG: IS66 family insertion sequence element accessory protein TnpB [Ferrovum myxofaciens]